MADSAEGEEDAMGTGADLSTGLGLALLSTFTAGFLRRPAAYGIGHVLQVRVMEMGFS